MGKNIVNIMNFFNKGLTMFFKKEKIENKIFEKSNERAYHDLIYILGSKKEIIKRNFLGGIARGIGIRDRGNNSYSNYCMVT